MNIMAGQPDGVTREQMRRHINQYGSAPRGAPPLPPAPPPPSRGAPPPPPPGCSPPPPPPPPRGATRPSSAPHPSGTPRPAAVPPPGRAPPPSPSGGGPRQCGTPPRRHRASSHRSPSASDCRESNSDDRDNPRPPVCHHLCSGPGTTGQTGGSVTMGDARGVVRQGNLVGGVWKMEVVMRKVVREAPRETMIAGIWVLRVVVAVVVVW